MKNLIQSVLLLIVVFVSAAETDKVKYVQVGGTVKLPLPEAVNLQKHYVYWSLEEGGTDIAWRNTLGRQWTSEDDPWKNRLSWSDDHTLVIKNIKQENFGTFVCDVKEKGTTIFTTKYKLLTLTVTVTPSSLLLPGDSLSLACTAQNLQGHKKPQIHWLNPQQEKKSQQSITKIVTSQDHGRWTCVATNNREENKADVSVTVVDLSPPASRPQYTSKSRPLTIPCSIPTHISWEQINATGIKEVHWHFIPKLGSSPQRLFFLSPGNPMTWKKDKDRGLSVVSDLKKKNLSLTRVRGTEEDKGDYVCALEFKNGVILSRTVHVQVLQITSSPGTELISGQQLNLTCGLGQPLPSDLYLKWIPPVKSSSSSSLTSHHHPTHLTIPQVGTGDSGKWRCELWQSNTQLTSAEIMLKIEPRLSVWMLVVICSVTVIVLLLLLLVFILCRRRQRKMRHLRHRLCQCKNPKPKGFYRT